MGLDLFLFTAEYFRAIARVCWFWFVCLLQACWEMRARLRNMSKQSFTDCCVISFPLADMIVEPLEEKAAYPSKERRFMHSEKLLI